MRKYESVTGHIRCTVYRTRLLAGRFDTGVRQAQAIPDDVTLPAVEPSDSTTTGRHWSPVIDVTGVADGGTADAAGVAGRAAARLKEEVNQTGTCCFCLQRPPAR